MNVGKIKLWNSEQCLSSRQTWAVGASSACRRMRFDPGGLWDNPLQHVRWGLRQLGSTPSFSHLWLKTQDRSHFKARGFLPCKRMGKNIQNCVSQACDTSSSMLCSVLKTIKRSVFFVTAQNCTRECQPREVGKANLYWVFTIGQSTRLSTSQIYSIT